MTLYDPVTKQVHKGGWGTTGGYQTTYISTNPATHGRVLTTLDPLGPKGFSSAGSARMPYQQSDAYNQMTGFVRGAIESKINKLYPYYATTSDGGRGTNYLYKPEVAKALQRDTAKLELARRSAYSFADTLWNKYEGVFFHNQAGDLQKSFDQFDREYQRNKENFIAKYGNRVDARFFDDAAFQTKRALVTRANQGTPAPKSKLFGFIPIKVSGPVQMSVATGLGVAASFLGPVAAGAGAGGTAPSSAVPVSFTGATVQSGGFVANLGIRGAQAVALAGTGATPGGAIGLTGLSSSGFVVGAAGGLVSTAPAVTAVSPTALNLGIVSPSIQPTWIDKLLAKVSAAPDDAISYVKDNPVKAAIGATGTALTLKKVSESPNPLAALINTVSSAVGLGPIVNPGGPGNAGPPLAFGSSLTGGGGGGGGSYGGAYTQAATSSLIGIGLFSALGLVAFLVMRKG